VDKREESLLIECKNCQEYIYEREYIANLRVCSKCDFHDSLSVEERIDSLFDKNSFHELDQGLSSVDPLEFKDIKPYKERLKQYEEKTSRKSAVVAGTARINSIPIQVALMDFSFAGGSMGSAEGEKIVRTFERSLETKQPAFVLSASGGARMQESIYSLMQMAKTSGAIAKLNQAGIPYISLLTNPTSGGVTASFSMLGDVNLAEPGALICFAGPRVIKQTIGVDIPKNFQRSEYLLEHGMIDKVCHRKELRGVIGDLLQLTVNN